MHKKRIITIAGKPGSGKSSTANRVAEQLGYQRFSSGDFMRSIANTRGVSIEELNRLAEADESIDHDVDAAVRKAGNLAEVVIDSRLAFHWIPDSFKVYLDLDLQTAAERILGDATEMRMKGGEIVSAPEELAKQLAFRLESERRRYGALYGVDHTDLSQFDLVIDTGKFPIEGVVSQVLAAYNSWLED
jgi:cytidylate kinase